MPVPPRRRPEGLAPQLRPRRVGHSLGIRTHTRAGPGRPAPGVGGHPRAPGHRVVAAASATATAVRPETGRRPAPDPAPRQEREQEREQPRPRARPGPPPAEPAGNLGLLRASRSAAAQSPDDDAASAARGPRSLRVANGLESSRNFPSAGTGSRGYPEAGGRLPRASNRSAANGAARSRGWQRDFRVRPSDAPLPMKKVDQSKASLKAASAFKASKGSLLLAAAWPNG